MAVVGDVLEAKVGDISFFSILADLINEIVAKFAV